jgi:hypothetical protein
VEKDLTGAFCPRSQESPEDGPPRHILGNARCLAVKPVGWMSTTAAFGSVLAQYPAPQSHFKIVRGLAKVIVLPETCRAQVLSLRMRLRAIWRSAARLLGPLSKRFLAGSSFMTTSRHQCRRFSTPQRERCFCAMTVPPTSDPTLCQFLRAMQAILFRWK